MSYNHHTRKTFSYILHADSQQITSLLVEWGNWNQKALEDLMPLVYDELRQSARSSMSRQSANPV